MEREELLFRKHERDAQRGRELLTDKEFLELEKQWEEASKELRILPMPDFGIKDFVDEIVKPRAERMSGAIARYCIDMEKRAMEVAIDFDSRAVYVAEWTEVTETDTPERHGYSFDMHFAVYPYRLRGLAFERVRPHDGHVRIIDFKALIAMPPDEFSAIRSENRETAERLRRHFHANNVPSGRTIHDRLY